MEHVKILIVSEENELKRSLKKYFIEWGIEPLEFSKQPDLSVIKAISPQLIFMEKKYFDGCSFLSKITDQQFKGIVCPEIVVVLKPGETMPLMQEAGEYSILQIPYLPATLFGIVKQALSSKNMESSLALILSKLDTIYSILIYEMKYSLRQEIKKPVSEKNRSLVSSQETTKLFEKNTEILPKAKSLVLSLMKAAKTNHEFGKYQSQLQMLEKYINELENDYFNDDSELEAIPDLLKSHHLSRKERKIFSMISKGMTTEAIAEALYISPETVKSHRRNIRKKLSLVGNKVSLGDFGHRLKEKESVAHTEVGDFIEQVNTLKLISNNDSVGSDWQSKVGKS